jgi:hypothetical protein
MEKSLLLKIIILISVSPVLLLIEFLYINGVLSLVSTASDIAVLVGVIGIGGFIIGNYFLINYIIKIFKTKTK